jgi:hypothetical protein
MTGTATALDADDLAGKVGYVVGKTFPRYSRFVDREDMFQDVYLYALKEERQFGKWRERDEPHRIFLALFGAAKQFGEQEKAQQSGYQFEDVAWYAPARIADLLPLAMDPTFDCLPGTGLSETGRGKQSSGREGGTLLAMIVDIRRALRACPAAEFTVRSQPDDSGEYADALVALADWLGGEFPDSPSYRRGRRKVMSNAAAAALTGAESGAA